MKDFVTFVLCVLIAPSVLVWLGWNGVYLIPAHIKDAAITLVPYGLAIVAWGLLAYLASDLWDAFLR